MKSKVILFIILLLLLFSITGCWDSIELNERIIISGIGIDKDEDSGKIQLTIQSVIPDRMGTPIKAGSEAKKAVHVYTTEAESLQEALRQYSIKVNGTPYFAQNRIIVVGSKAAREGVMPLIDFFRRFRENNIRAYIMITEGKAADILNWESEKTRIPTDHIISLINSRNYIANSITETLHEFALKLLSKTTSPTTAEVEIVKSVNGEAADIDISHTSVFKKDKLSGYLNDSETRGLAWITNEYVHGTVEARDSMKENITLTEMVLRSNTEIIPELTNGTIKMKIGVKEEGMVIMQPGDIDISSQKSIGIIENEFSEGVNNDIAACLKKVQKDYQTDIFGFGEAIHRKYPKKWRELEGKWDKMFPEIPVEINAEVKIRSFGSNPGK
jgi:spore germination protein KC